jgi:THO complex subunit 1
MYFVQSSAVQSGEQIMQYGQSIDDGETTQGHIPRLLGLYKVLLAKSLY